MDLLGYVLCLLLGVALPTTGFVLVVRRAWRQVAVADAYRAAARELQLSVDTRGVSLHGHLGASSLYVGEILQGFGPARRHLYQGLYGLETPLGLGLRVSRPHRHRRRAPSSRRVLLGDEAFDKAFVVEGDDASRVRALLQGPVREALGRFHGRWSDLVVTDHHLQVHLPRPEATADGLRELVDTLRRLAEALEVQRRQVPVPEALEACVEDWERLAGLWGLTLRPELPALLGELEGRRLGLWVRREPGGYAAELRLSLAPHRATGLRLTPQAPESRREDRGQDILVGDPAFDERFVVKGYDPDRIRDLLAQPVRAGLLELAEHGAVELDDLQLRIRHLPLDADLLEPLLPRACGVAALTRW